MTAGAVLLDARRQSTGTRRREASARRSPRSACVAALLLVSVALAGLDPIRLHHRSQATTGVAGAARARLPRRWHGRDQRRTRLAAAALALLAVSAAVLSFAGLPRSVRNGIRFSSKAPAISPETVEGEPDRTVFRFLSRRSRVQLSPGGQVHRGAAGLGGRRRPLVDLPRRPPGRSLAGRSPPTRCGLSTTTRCSSGEDDQEGPRCGRSG